ncbi:Conserved_hypothetical protein [Hexamita inflata]|uniref:Uncharacterized protein n=1 Tax=Hexamita inflata TaxID=28002 RepID=A0ABP1GK00_9EUKA
MNQKQALNEQQSQEIYVQVKDGYLEISSQDTINDLKFVQKFNVTKLKLNNCKNIQLQTIQTPLEVLIVDYCNQQSLNISHLQSLKTLKFSNNIQTFSSLDNFSIDISALQNMVQLTSLDLSCNRLKDISALKLLINLTYLNLEYNDYIDVNMLKDMIQLEKLNLKFTNLKDISILSQFHKLSELNISSNQGIDLTPIKQMTNLENIDVSVTYPQDINFLKNLVKLKRLDLGNNRELIKTHRTSFQDHVVNISKLKQLTNIQTLILNRNGIQDITVLEYLPYISKLSIHDNKITNIDSLVNLTYLEILLIQSNKIINIEPIANLVNLVQLNVSLNKIQSFECMQHHKNFDKYVNFQQSQPSDKEILFSSKQTQIHQQTKRLKNMNVKKRFNHLKFLQNKISSSFSKAFQNHKKFLENVANLLTSMGITEQYQ